MFRLENYAFPVVFHYYFGFQPYDPLNIGLIANWPQGGEPNFSLVIYWKPYAHIKHIPKIYNISPNAQLLRFFTYQTPVFRHFKLLAAISSLGGRHFENEAVTESLFY